MPQQAARKAAVAAMAEELFSLSTAAWQVGHQSRASGRWDLSESEFLAIDLLVRHGTLTVGQIQRQIAVLPAQMSRIVRALEGKFDKPLIDCTINPQDKRKVNVSLTETGRLAHQEFRESRLAHTVEVLSQVSDQDLEDFMRIIRSIRRSLVRSVKPGD